MWARQHSILRHALPALGAVLWLCACGDDAGDAPPSAKPDATVPTPDAGHADAGTRRDAGAPDTGQDAGHASDAGVEPDAAVPETLADTGLYADGSTTELAPGVRPFAPRYALWSDGATKNRYIYLPPDTQIDTSNMDHWRFADGTKAWKEFTRSGVRVETRLIEKRDGAWRMLAFAWNAEQTEAVALPSGQQNALMTEHDIPSGNQCKSCHAPLPDRLAGFSAIQLSHSGSGVTLATLIAESALSAPPPADFARPDTLEWNVLGYMHANCGNCHNPHGEAFDKADGLELWLTTAALGSASATVSYTTTVGVATAVELTGFTTRIVAGNADTSALYERVRMTRGTDGAMPPLATELEDTAALMQLETWIDGL